VIDFEICPIFVGAPPDLDIGDLAVEVRLEGLEDLVDEFLVVDGLLIELVQVHYSAAALHVSIYILIKLQQWVFLPTNRSWEPIGIIIIYMQEGPRNTQSTLLTPAHP
jgi:hypothetical protein